MFSEEKIHQIILSKIDPEGKEYLIKSISREKPISNEGTTVHIDEIVGGGDFKTLFWKI